MRVTVTGGTGNLGTAVVTALCREPAVAEVLVAARRPPTTWELPGRARFVRVDVGSDDLTPVVAGSDAVVHLAWLFQPTRRPAITWQANAVGSSRVFAAAARAGAGALVHASSVGAYSPGPGRTVDESWPTHSVPTAGYGREKAYAERALDGVEARHPEMRIVRVRPAFVFQRASGTQQRRLFIGPFLPRSILRAGRLPALPLPAGLRFQALHASDVGRAIAAACLADVRGAFNLAAEPVLDGSAVADIVGAPLVEVPRWLMRSGVAAAWHARLVPVEPPLLDLVLGLPLLDTGRARTELDWAPRVPADVALREAFGGMAEGAGGGTAPLAPDSFRGRVHEVATGVGASGL